MFVRETEIDRRERRGERKTDLLRENSTTDLLPGRKGSGSAHHLNVEVAVWQEGHVVPTV